MLSELCTKSRDAQRAGHIPCLAAIALTVAGATITVCRAEGTESGVSKQNAPSVLHYMHHEHLIAMRDGVRLYTSVFSPDDEANDYPILLVRTPYDAPRSLPPAAFAKAGYIFVFQSVRGRYQSEGKFIEMTPQKDGKRQIGEVDESTDTYDSIDWLIRHVPHNNERVGLIGTSYPGFYAAAGMIRSHAALKAVSPQAPQADWFVGDDVHHHGAFLLSSMFGFVSRCLHRVDASASTRCTDDGFDAGTYDGYQFFFGLEPLRNIDSKVFHGSVPAWNEVMTHGTYDEYWQARNLLPHIRDVRPAVLVVGGWYDANDFYGSLQVYQRLAAQSPPVPATLVVGPWYHGQWSIDDGSRIDRLIFGNATADYFTKTIELPFFDHYLKDGPDPKLPRAIMFETGENSWRRFSGWPPTERMVRNLYLREKGALSFRAPESAPRELYDEYISDPQHPVPYISEPTIDMDPKYMTRDQGFVQGRPDILVYEGDVLDADLTVAGPIVPQLFVTTSGTDSDWIIRLIDVFPIRSPTYLPSAANHLDTADSADMAGFELLVRGDVIRGKFRRSLTRPEPMTPGEVTPIEFTMDDVLHTFKKGHRIMVQIQSTWFPLVDINPQKFIDIYHASPRDFQVARQRIYRSASKPSHLRLYVLGATP
jgi:putative CocE/NonD family hydrolase